MVRWYTNNRQGNEPTTNRHRSDMTDASKIKESGTIVTRIGKYGEVGIAYEMPDGTIYKTSGGWAEKSTAHREIIRDAGQCYRERVMSLNIM